MSDENLRRLLREARSYGLVQPIVSKFLENLTDEQLNQAYLQEIERRRGNLPDGVEIFLKYFECQFSLCGEINGDKGCDGTGCSLCESGLIPARDFPLNFARWEREHQVVTFSVDDEMELAPLKDFQNHLLIYTKIDHGDGQFDQHCFVDLGSIKPKEGD